MSDDPSSFQNEMQTSCIQYPIRYVSNRTSLIAIGLLTAQVGIFEKVGMDGNFADGIGIVRNAASALGGRIAPIRVPLVRDPVW